VLPGVTDTSGDRFCIQIRGTSYHSRVHAAHALAQWAHGSDLKWAPRYGSRDYGVIGQISGFDIHIATHARLGALNVDVQLVGVPRSEFTLTRDTFLDGGTGLIQRIENRVSGIPAFLKYAQEDLASAEQAIAEANERIGKPFRHTNALHEAEQQLTRIETELAQLQQRQRTESSASPGPESSPDAGRVAGSREPPRSGLGKETVRSRQPALGIARPIDSRNQGARDRLPPFNADHRRRRPSVTGLVL
jgi:hypothetical protein